MSRWPVTTYDGDEYLGSEEIVGGGELVPTDCYLSRFLRRAEIAMGLAKICESPIEVQFGAALTLLIPGSGFTLVEQYPWLRWRMDFALIRADVPAMFIECDGAEFHSTPAQIANDRRKDAATKAAGIELLRFTGSDIYQTADHCAAIVMHRLAQDHRRRA